MGVTPSQPLPSPEPTQVKFFFRNASGDILSAINYFDFRDDIWGGGFVILFFFATPVCTHKYTEGRNPKPMEQPPFSQSFIKQNLWKRKWSDTAQSSSFRCCCQVLAAGPRGREKPETCLCLTLTFRHYLTCGVMVQYRRMLHKIN